MKREEFEKRVKDELYKQRKALDRKTIDETVESERDWLNQYYDEANGDFEHAVDLAVANFGLWV